MTLQRLLVCFILIFFAVNSGYAGEKELDVLIEGYDDGVKSTLRNDREEALIDAKRQAVERAGVRMSSSTQMENFVVKRDWVESNSKAVLLPGFQIIDKGYQADGSYLVILSGRIRPLMSNDQAGRDDFKQKTGDIRSDSIYQQKNWEILKGKWAFNEASITSKYGSEENCLILKKELKDYIMEVTATKIRGGVSYITIGIRQNVFEGGYERVFRNNTSSRQGYQFGILLDGRYNLFNGLDGRYYTIGNVTGEFNKNWDTSPLIDLIQNRLRFEVIGDHIKIFINGKRFAEFQDNSHLYGSPMLIVSQNNEIRFSDINIRPIEK